MSRVRRFVLVVSGGMAGSLVRYLVVAEGAGVRVGLVAVNLVGALLAGWLVGRIPHHSHRARWLLPLAVVGTAGALTTFSTVALDTVVLMDSGQWSEALSLGAASLVLGPIAAVGGLWAGRRA